MKKKKIQYVSQPPKVFASCVPAAAAVIRQNYNVASGEYYPSRKLLPLVVTPVIGYTVEGGGKSVENAASQLVNGHWYRLDNSTAGNDASAQFSAATEIVNGSRPDSSTPAYAIDTAVGSPTYGQLTSYEDVSPSNPVTYVFRATLNVGGGYEVSCSIQLDTVTVSVIPVLTFDNDARMIYNPWDPGMPAKVTINPKVYPASLAVSYDWLFFLEGKWVALDSTFESWAVSRSGDGVVIDRPVMPDSISLKCVARVDVNGTAVTLEKILTQRRRLPAFEYDIIQVAGISEGTSYINPSCLIQTGKSVITDPGDEASADWYGQGSAPIATGMNPQIPVSALGADMELGVKVSDLGGWKALTDDDGEELTDDDGELIICK